MAGRTAATLLTWSTASRRNAPASSAASSGDSGGQRRVFTRPARGALAITASTPRPVKATTRRGRLAP